MAKKRNYRSEYDNYQGKPAQIKARSRRNSANRKKGTYGNGDGKDVAHLDNDTKNNSDSNLKLQSKKKNRSFPRTKGARRAKKKP